MNSTAWRQAFKENKAHVYALAFAFLTLFVLPFVSAMQAPCSQDQLMNSSDFVVEGDVVDKTCDKPTNVSGSREGCYAQITECSHRIKVSKSIKGQQEPGDIVIYTSSVTSHHSVKSSNEVCTHVGPTQYGDIELDMNDTIRFYHPADSTGIGCPNYIEHIELNRTSVPEECHGSECMIPVVIISFLFLALLAVLLFVLFWRR